MYIIVRKYFKGHLQNVQTLHTESSLMAPNQKPIDEAIAERSVLGNTQIFCAKLRNFQSQTTKKKP